MRRLIVLQLLAFLLTPIKLYNASAFIHVVKMTTAPSTPSSRFYAGLSQRSNTNPIRDPIRQHKHTHKHTCMHVHTQTYTHVHAQFAHTYNCKHTHIYTHACMHAHTYKHTHINILRRCCLEDVATHNAKDTEISNTPT